MRTDGSSGDVAVDALDGVNGAMLPGVSTYGGVGRRITPLSFTANSLVDPSKHSRHRTTNRSIAIDPSTSPGSKGAVSSEGGGTSNTVNEQSDDYAEEVVVDYEAVRKGIAEALSVAVNNTGLIFR